MLTPFVVHLGNVLPIMLETEVLSHQIRDHENGAGCDADYVDDFLVRIVRLDVISVETPSELEEPRVRVATGLALTGRSARGHRQR